MTHTILSEYFGMMPNQAWGTLNGKGFYFRARHGSWALHTFPVPAGSSEEEMKAIYINEGNGLTDIDEIVAQGDDDRAGWWEGEEVGQFVEARLQELDQ